jgi:hypothetical protein
MTHLETIKIHLRSEDREQLEQDNEPQAFAAISPKPKPANRYRPDTNALLPRAVEFNAINGMDKALPELVHSACEERHRVASNEIAHRIAAIVHSERAIDFDAVGHPSSAQESALPLDTDWMKNGRAGNSTKTS